MENNLLLYSEELKCQVINEQSIQRGDIIRYRFEQAGQWERWYSAMVLKVDTYQLEVMTDRAQHQTWSLSELFTNQATLIMRTADDPKILQGQIMYKDLTEEELEALSDGTKKAIQRKAKEIEYRRRREQDEGYRDELFKGTERRRTKRRSNSLD